MDHKIGPRMDKLIKRHNIVIHDTHAKLVAMHDNNNSAQPLASAIE